MTFLRALFPLLGLCSALWAQRVQVREIDPLYLPTQVDSNSPAVWIDGRMTVYSSYGVTYRASGWSQLELDEVEFVPIDGARQPIWIEAAWRDAESGTILAWYHHEPGRVCPNSELSFPEIGALISEDGGATFTDLGIVLRAGDVPNCAAGNGFFAGGHGDFSVILSEGYFYFLFTNYSGPADSQGVALARMAFEDRLAPVGRVFKYHGGDWSEPGLDGAVSPVLPAVTPWDSDKADSFWGPSVHFNTAIQRHVVLLNRACCAPRWPQEGIYVSFIGDLTDPASWSKPSKILDFEEIGQDPAFYPQVLGLQLGETDTLASRTARLYIQGVSKWELTFLP